MYSKRLMMNHLCNWLKQKEKTSERKRWCWKLGVIQLLEMRFTYDSEPPVRRSKKRNLTNFRVIILWWKGMYNFYQGGQNWKLWDKQCSHLNAVSFPVLLPLPRWHKLDGTPQNSATRLPWLLILKFHKMLCQLPNPSALHGSFNSKQTWERVPLKSLLILLSFLGQCTVLQSGRGQRSQVTITLQDPCCKYKPHDPSCQGQSLEATD